METKDNKINVPEMTYYQEVCANIRQYKVMQWQVLIVSVAMISAVPLTVKVTEISLINDVVQTIAILFCIIACVYSIWHIHRYQCWLTYERKHRKKVEDAMFENDLLPLGFRSSHSKGVSYKFDIVALISWWALIVLVSILSVVKLLPDGIA